MSLNSGGGSIRPTIGQLMRLVAAAAMICYGLAVPLVDEREIVDKIASDVMIVFVLGGSFGLLFLPRLDPSHSRVIFRAVSWVALAAVGFTLTSCTQEGDFPIRGTLVIS